MHRVEPAAFHALEQHQMSARIDDRDAHRDAGFLGARDRGGHDSLRAGGGEPLGVGNVHGAPPRGIY